MKLEEGEVVCSKCEGNGYFPLRVKPDENQMTCSKCNGKGKVDWFHFSEKSIPRGFNCSISEGRIY